MTSLINTKALIGEIYFIILYDIKINFEDIVYNEIRCERIKWLNVKWTDFVILMNMFLPTLPVKCL